MSANVVALSDDAALLDLLKRSMDGRRHVWRADDAVHAADLLVAAPTSVLLVDAAVNAHGTPDVIRRLAAQFPDLPIIVTGRLDDEVELGPLISAGTVFRFLHKPVSLERARNFIEAAVKRLDLAPAQQPPGPELKDYLPRLQFPSLQLSRLVPSPATFRRSASITIVLAVLALLAWGAAEIVARQPWRALQAAFVNPSQAPAPEPERVAVQRLVDAAGVALAQGHLVEPAGRNAVELYRSALARDPGNIAARQGLSRVADELLRRVEQALLDSAPAVAASALDAARSAAPDHPRLAFLSAQLAEETERLRQQRAEATSGRPAAERALEQRLAALLAVADQRLKAGRLVGGLDSAEAYVLEARQIAPDAPGVRQAVGALSAAMLQDGRRAWADGNESVARNWLQRAKALGADPEGVAQFSAQIAAAAMATMVEDRSRLLALANQRLAQGRLLDPATDSAQHYLDLLRAAQPDFPGVADTGALLAARLIAEAQRLSDGDRHDEAARHLAAAEAAGAAPNELRAAQRALDAARAVAEAARTILPERTLERVAGSAPRYPQRAAARGVEGWVHVEFTVAADGTTRDAVVVDASSPGDFDEAVLEAVKNWRYRPHVVAGTAVDQRVQARLRFELSGG